MVKPYSHGQPTGTINRVIGTHKLVELKIGHRVYIYIAWPF